MLQPIEIEFTQDFPLGQMQRPGAALNKWVAKGVQGLGVVVPIPAGGIPAGSLVTLVETIPDTYAAVQVLERTGTVQPFTNTYVLTITPPSSGDEA